MSRRVVVERIVSLMKQGLNRDQIVDVLLNEGLIPNEDEAVILTDMVFIYFFVAQELNAGKSEDEVRQELLDMGLPEEFADQYLMEFRFMNRRV